MSHHAVVTSEEHRDLRVRTEASGDLGDALMACPAVPDEFRALQNEFVILFRRDPETRSFSALVLMGFEAGENLYLQNGGWAARYRPLGLAAQPFLIGRPENGEGPGQVHIDMGHPRISTNGEGTRLFDDNGMPSSYLERIASILGALDEGFRESPAFHETLERLELLEPFALDVALTDSKHRMVGYHLINEERLSELEPSLLAELQAAGYLMPIFMAVASLSNLSKLVEWKNRIAHG